MRIIHCLNHFLPQQTSGTEIYVLALCKQLQKKGFESEVLIPNYGNSNFENYVYDKLSVTKYPELSVVNRKLITGQVIPTGVETFATFLKKVKPDVVHFHEIAGSNGISIHHIEVAKKLGFKVIMTFHLAGNTCKTGTLMYKDKEPCDGVIRMWKCSYCRIYQQTTSDIRATAILLASTPLQMLGLNPVFWNHPFATALSTPNQIEDLREKLFRLSVSCDVFVCLTDWYLKVLVTNGLPPEKIVVVKQALPLETLTTIKGNKPEKKLKLIFVGRIDPLKGVHLIVEAGKKLVGLPVEIDIFGSASDVDFLEHQKKISPSTVNFKGKLNPKEVVSTMQQYNALLLPSTFSEMSPLVIQQAFAAGLPVIASGVPGNAEQITHGVNGFLFPMGNSSILQSLLKRLIAQPEELEACRKNIESPKSFETVAEEMIIIYNKVCS